MTVHDQPSGVMGHADATTPLLELNDVSVHYGAVVALDQVSVKIYPGEVVALRDPTGRVSQQFSRPLWGWRLSQRA